MSLAREHAQEHVQYVFNVAATIGKPWVCFMY
jgi:hypothetical protein